MTRAGNPYDSAFHSDSLESVTHQTSLLEGSRLIRVAMNQQKRRIICRHVTDRRGISISPRFFRLRVL